MPMCVETFSACLREALECGVYMRPLLVNNVASVTRLNVSKEVATVD